MQHLYVVLTANDYQLDNSKNNYYAAEIPCRLDDGVNCKILLNHMPVSGDLYQMVNNALKLIEDDLLEKEAAVLTSVVIKIITNENHLNDALILASLFVKNKREIVLTNGLSFLFWSFKNILVSHRDYVFSSKFLNQENDLLEKCVFQNCDKHTILNPCCDECLKYNQDKFSKISQYTQPGSLLRHECKHVQCIHVLKHSNTIKTINISLDNIDYELKLELANTYDAIIKLKVDSKRVFRQKIGSMYNVSPRSWFVDLIVNRLLNLQVTGNYNKTFFNQLFINRETPKWCKSFKFCYFKSNLKNLILPEKTNSILAYQILYPHTHQYKHGWFGKMFHTYFIHELYHAAHDFLIELNWHLKKSFKMNEVILYGGAVLSVLTGTDINDYDLTLKIKLSHTEMLSLVKAFANKYQVYVDTLDNPKKMQVIINNRVYDFNNLVNMQEWNFSKNENFYPQHVYVEFNMDSVEKVVCSELANKHLMSGTIDISNLFADSKAKKFAAKYLTKGFIPAGECETDSELAYIIIDHLFQAKCPVNILKRVNIEKNELNLNPELTLAQKPS
jgi:hypothetical protein